MEIDIKGQVYTFKEEITLDEFLEIGMPPMNVIEKMENATKNNQSYIPAGEELKALLNFQKRLMNKTCIIAPNNKKDFGKLPLALFNQIASHPKFGALMGKILSGEE